MLNGGDPSPPRLAAASWDQAYSATLADLMQLGAHVETTKRGSTKELLSYHFTLNNPRDRIIFNPARALNVFQTIGMWLWMAAGRSDLGFVSYYNPGARKYSADLRQVEGAYGPRLFGSGANWQIPRCVQTLRQRPQSRQVIAMVYDAVLDAHRHEHEDRAGEVPCTISLQYFLREGKLHAITNMRSQEAVFLLPQDVCHFTMFQEFVAASLGVEVGSYSHHAGSMHFYEERPIQPYQITPVTTFDRWSMPAMTMGDQMPYLLETLKLEERIRINALDWMAQEGKRANLDSRDHFREARDLPPFWRSLIHACIGQAAIHVQHKHVLKDMLEKVDPWLQPFVRKAYELKGGERLLDNYGLIEGYEPLRRPSPAT